MCPPIVNVIKINQCSRTKVEYKEGSAYYRRTNDIIEKNVNNGKPNGVFSDQLRGYKKNNPSPIAERVISSLSLCAPV